MLSVSLSPCRRFHPAEVAQPRRVRFRLIHAAFALDSCGLGLRDLNVSRPHPRSLALRPGDSPPSLRKALSIGFRSRFPSYLAIQATGLLTLTPAGLSPAEHASLRWTHASDHFVTSMPAGCSRLERLPGGTCTRRKAPPLTAHAANGGPGRLLSGEVHRAGRGPHGRHSSTLDRRASQRLLPAVGETAAPGISMEATA